MKALSDLYVLDLSSVLAGPSAATFFAELGAKVVKIENAKTGGDVTRNWKLPSEDPEASISAYYASVNFGKETCLADLSSDEGQALMQEHLAKADILIQNFKSRDLPKFRLEPDALKASYPRLIHCQLTGFEEDSERLAYDVVLQAESGFMGMNGSPESGPIKMPVALIDVLAAHQMKEAILLALFQRERSGSGCFVRCSLEASALASLVNQASNYLMRGHIARRLGSLHPNIAPYGEQFTCADSRSVVVAIGSDKQFAKFCDLLDCKHLMDDPRFASNPTRVIHRSALAEALQEGVSRYRADALLKSCHKAGVPIGEIKDMAAVCQSPVAQSMRIDEEIEGQASSRLSSIAFRIDE